MPSKNPQDILPEELRKLELLAAEGGTIAQGVEYRSFHFKELYGGPLSLSMIVIDWDKASVKAGLKYAGDSRRKTSEMAREAGAIAATNGGYFKPRALQAPLPYYSLKINGKLLDCSNPGGDGTVAFSGSELPFVGKFKKEFLEKYENVLSADGLVFDGKTGLAKTGTKAPHTGIGLTPDRKLIILAIDGRHKESQGMNLGEMAEFMIKLGCDSGISLDGGGSTTMYVSGFPGDGVVNHPSDSKRYDLRNERAVCDIFFIAPSVK